VLWPTVLELTTALSRGLGVNGITPQPSRGQPEESRCCWSGLIWSGATNMTSNHHHGWPCNHTRTHAHNLSSTQVRLGHIEGHSADYKPTEHVSSAATNAFFGFANHTRSSHHFAGLCRPGFIVDLRASSPDHVNSSYGTPTVRPTARRPSATVKACSGASATSGY
jgi:hypothetical protein